MIYERMGERIHRSCEIWLHESLQTKLSRIPWTSKMTQVIVIHHRLSALLCTSQHHWSSALAAGASSSTGISQCVWLTWATMQIDAITLHITHDWWYLHPHYHYLGPTVCLGSLSVSWPGVAVMIIVVAAADAAVVYNNTRQRPTIISHNRLKGNG